VSAIAEEPQFERVVEIRALLIEDNPDDADLVQEALSDEALPTVEVTWVQTLADGIKCLEAGNQDVVLLDLSLPDCQSLDTLVKLRVRFSEVPVVILTGLDDKELALESVRRGAQDYLVKGKPSGESICRSMRYAIERKRTDELEKKLSLFDQREEFIAMLAHDLRSPLYGANRMLNLMLKGSLGPIPDWQKESLSVLKNSNESILLMIGNVLETYRFEDGKQSLVFAPVSVAKVLTTCSDEMAPLAMAKELVVENSISEVPEILADEIAIKRVISNLYSNAIKFTPQGGAIQLTLSAKNNLLSVYVKDTGIGMTPEQQSHLFQRFWQGGDKLRFGGVGLGLYLSNKLVDAHHGTIRCESKLGVGTTFEVCLPIGKNGSNTKYGA